MGDAKIRKHAEQVWRQALDEDETVLVATAERLLSLRPHAGACYRMSLFMKLYLEEVHQVSTSAVVGFVNDGTDDLYVSHAWLDYRGQVTDISLAAPQHPDIQPPGPVLIHGFEMWKGWRYSYHEHRPPLGLQAVQRLLNNPRDRPHVQQAEELHLTMVARAKSNDLIRAYLDSAPDE